MRIAHFYKHFLESGGMPRETNLLAGHMCPYADEVFVYCLSTIQNGNHPVNDGAGAVIRSFYLPSFLYQLKTNLIVPSSLRRWLKNNEDELDIVVLTGSFISEHLWLSTVLHQSGIPYIVSIGDAFNPHLWVGSRGVRKKIYHYLIERHVIRGAAALRLYSEIQREHLRKVGHSDAKTFVVKEGVDWEQVPKAMLGRSCAVAQDPPIFGYLGRFDIYQKGLDILLDGFARYRRRGGSGRLMMVGPACERALRKIYELTDQWDIGSWVDIGGPLYGEEKYIFLKSLSILCVPSRHEGIPRVVRECLAVGCPVIVTEDTNLHDLIAASGAGFVVDMDASNLANAMLAYEFYQREQKLRLSVSAVEVAKQLNWDLIACEYAENIGNLLQGRRGDY